MTRIMLIVCATMLAVPAVYAATNYEDGNSLLRQCRNADTTDSFETGMCIGFILGTHSGYFIAQTGIQPRLVFCAPRGVTNLQTVKVVTKFLKEHPEALHQSADLLVIEAMTAAFPCAEPEKPKK